MKNLFSILLVMAIAIGSQAQTFTTTNSGGGFRVDSGTSTGEYFEVDGQKFEMFTTSKGSRYIKCESMAKQTSYAVWIGTETEFEFEGRTVYQSKKGSYCIYKISANSGNPYPVWLTVLED